jgi:undecaprenyl-diphosphatase
MDKSLFFLVNQQLQNSFFDYIMPFITQKPFVLFAIIAIPFFLKDWKKSLLVMSLCFIALIIGDSSANMFKHLFGRARPCQGLDGIRLLVSCGKSFSLPSGHAVNVFAVAATYAHFFRKTVIPMLLFALLVAFSRVYVGVHYPFDVLAGAFWGGMISVVILAAHSRLSEKYSGGFLENIISE